MSFKTIFTIAASCFAIFVIMSFFHDREVQSIKEQWLAQIRENAELEERHTDEIGDYYTQITQISLNLEKEKSLSKDLRKTLKSLQKELGTKIDLINMITIQVDTLKNSGNSVITQETEENRIYKLTEHSGGVTLSLGLEHPSGVYNYMIIHDPIEIELYTGRTKDNSIEIGSIRFPTADYLSVSSWRIIKDEDTRKWYEKIWENTHCDIGIFAGPNLGMSASIGYNKISVGPIVTEDGMSLGIWYKIK